jgi:hypothetical protein
MSLRMVNSTPMIASYDCTDKCPPVQTGGLKALETGNNRVGDDQDRK